MSGADVDAALIRELEERLLSPGVRGSRSELEALLADDFLEFGASGRRYDRAAAISALASRPAIEARLSEFALRSLGARCALATYVVELSARDAGGAAARSLRSSIWQRDASDDWRLVFHQGTPSGATP